MLIGDGLRARDAGQPRKTKFVTLSEQTRRNQLRQERISRALKTERDYWICSKVEDARRGARETRAYHHFSFLEMEV